MSRDVSNRGFFWASTASEPTRSEAWSRPGEIASRVRIREESRQPTFPVAIPEFGSLLKQLFDRCEDLLPGEMCELALQRGFDLAGRFELERGREPFTDQGHDLFGQNRLDFPFLS
jgi:hypothetical protein